MSSYELTDNLINAAVNKSEERTKSKKESEKDEKSKLAESSDERNEKNLKLYVITLKQENRLATAYQFLLPKLFLKELLKPVVGYLLIISL